MRFHSSLLAALGSIAACSAGAQSEDAEPQGPQATAASTPTSAVADANADAGAPSTGPVAHDPPSGRRLGAIVTGAREVTFRVWAPGAASAWVSGEVAGATRTAMQREGDLWVATLPGARAGQRYHYVFETNGATVERLDPYCRETAPAPPDCIVVDPSSYAWQSTSFKRAAPNATVVYEMHVGSFVADDAHPNGGFAAAKTGLSRLADLGVNVLELMPVQNFGGNQNGWGYNPFTYFAPKGSYGSSDALRAFVDAAHGQGMGLWLDVVFNHMDGWSRAPLRCFDGDCKNGGAGVYFFPQGGNGSTPWGPRPDYTKKQVSDMIVDSVDAWLTEFHGDGFRWDSTSNIRGVDGQGIMPGGRELLTRANDWAHKFGAMAVAEDLKGFDAITRSSAKGGFGFDGQWDGFGYDVTSVLAEANDDLRDLGRIEGTLRTSFNGDPFARLLFLENHDTVGNGGARLPVRIDRDNPKSVAARKRAMLGGVLLLTTPGIPMLFQGEEDLSSAGFADPPPRPLAPSAEGLAMRAFYKDMIRLRRNLDGRSGGLLEPDIEILQRNDASKVIAYRRHGGSNEDVVVVLNFRNQPYGRYDVGVATGGDWTVRVDTDRKAYGADFGGGGGATIAAIQAPRDGRPFTLPVALSAYGAVVLTH